MEVLDMTGPFDVFSMANIVKPKNNPNLFELFTVSQDGAPITAIHGLKIIPDFCIKTAPPCDILIIPGGAKDVIDGILTDKYPDIIDWVSRQKGKTPVIASVCVGAFFAAKAGIFDTLKATTHHGFYDVLEKTANGTFEVERGPRYVVNQITKTNIIASSAGVSAGLDLAFDLLLRLSSPETHQAVLTLMEYNQSIPWAEQPIGT
jgi:transcriptional regulator GlxA family with amidase domain